PVSAKFKGRLTLSDIDPPSSYSISFEGQGGAAGFAKGSAQVSLSSEGAHTRLSYEVKANVGGKLAQIGSRLVDAAAKKVADDFFKNFNDNFASATPSDPALPGVSDTTLRFLAAGALVVFVISMYFFLTWKVSVVSRVDRAANAFVARRAWFHQHLTRV